MTSCVTTLLVISVILGQCGCAFSRTVTITSDPIGAKMWLANQPVGPTPQAVRVETTGPLGLATHDETLVTLEKDGYETATRPISYRWSIRNTLWSIPLLGWPLIFLAEEPIDTHIVLISEGG
jgi:hypothetical protein